MANLSEIALTLLNVTPPDLSYVVARFTENVHFALWISNQNASYFKELLEIAETSILLEDLTPVHELALAIVFLGWFLRVQWLLLIAAKNDPELNTLLFGNSNYLRVFNILNCLFSPVSPYSIDYNDNYLEIHADHCSTFEHHIHYHDVLSISDHSLLDLIHITFRLIYIRVAPFYILFDARTPSLQTSWAFQTPESRLQSTKTSKKSSCSSATIPATPPRCRAPRGDVP